MLLKREDLAHTGSHKLNNVVGQALLTRRMGKRRLIAETGAGQHGVATATAAALLGLECAVYMGEVDTKRQELNVFRMELLGATVHPVRTGSRTLKDAVNEALREWVATVDDTHYCLGSVMGPHPFPYMVRELQRVVGDEARQQCRELLGGADPDVVVACVGRWLQRRRDLCRLRRHPGSARRGRGGRRCGRDRRHPRRPPRHALAPPPGRGGPDPRGGLHLGRARLPGHRARARPPRLDRPGRIRAATDEEVLQAFGLLAETEGIIPALEPAHALAWVAGEAGRSIPPGSTVLVTLSGRGDKDVAQVRELLGAGLR